MTPFKAHQTLKEVIIHQLGYRGLKAHWDDNYLVVNGGRVYVNFNEKRSGGLQLKVSQGRKSKIFNQLKEGGLHWAAFVDCKGP